MKADTLRKKYPRFFYRGYTYKHSGENLHISFDFSAPPDILFHPTLVIQNVPGARIKAMGDEALQNLVFQLGLVEMISYWKAVCSPEIVVEAGYLDSKQIAWWHDLVIKGMGEYFYKNKINFTKSNFLTITSLSREKLSSAKFTNLAELSFRQGTLVPVGGGKDAVVTLELLKKGRQRIVPFLLNPKKEQREILKVAGLKSPVVVTRIIDPKLLELNRKGYLNGHTPFSAYLAFLSVLCATLFDTKYVALSNERSSNEGNVRYLGKIINHQYSKSFDFEKRFRSYVKTYLAKDIEYFSFLRPLYELQIARIFAQYPKYFSAFLSCNEAHKTYSGRKPASAPRRGYGEARWCGKCAKCLFVWLALYPFVSEKQITNIFKKNLFQDKTLVPLLEELIGKKKFKPFECVGTAKESKAALSLCLQKQRGELPHNTLLSSWNSAHALPPRFSRLLSRAKIGGK
jgi:UDP-N-acetyl-alpha-D-muramoyl-L-alanyl-L-glutamate epimerase